LCFRWLQCLVWENKNKSTSYSGAFSTRQNTYVKCSLRLSCSVSRPSERADNVTRKIHNVTAAGITNSDALSRNINTNVSLRDYVIIVELRLLLISTAGTKRIPRTHYLAIIIMLNHAIMTFLRKHLRWYGRGMASWHVKCHKRVRFPVTTWHDIKVTNDSVLFLDTEWEYYMMSAIKSLRWNVLVFDAGLLYKWRLRRNQSSLVCLCTKQTAVTAAETDTMSGFGRCVWFYCSPAMTSRDHLRR